MSVTRVLAAVTGALEQAEDRAGQVQMAEAVAKAIELQRHLVVQAGTGTGKTLGYLVPALMSGKSVMVATATNRFTPMIRSCEQRSTPGSRRTATERPSA
jgi:ATP-dependent DNA helicase DinG